METRELRDLVAAWLVLGIAFGNLLGGLEIYTVAVALLTAGVGFLLHELAHRVVARRFHLAAEFRANYEMLAIAFFGSFAGVLFAAPGAVYTEGRRSPREQVLISGAGPATNILLGALFFFIPGIIGSYGFMINSWLALFNMIPFGGLDGESVYRHDKVTYFFMLGVSAAMVASFMIGF